MYIYLAAAERCLYSITDLYNADLIAPLLEKLVEQDKWLHKCQVCMTNSGHYIDRIAPPQLYVKLETRFRWLTLRVKTGTSATAAMMLGLQVMQ